jgi:hypothetical protein
VQKVAAGQPATRSTASAGVDTLAVIEQLAALHALRVCQSAILCEENGTAGPTSNRATKRISPCPRRFLSIRAYLDVTDNLNGILTASETVNEIAARLCEETRITTSAEFPATSSSPRLGGELWVRIAKFSWLTELLSASTRGAVRIRGRLAAALVDSGSPVVSRRVGHSDELGVPPRLLRASKKGLLYGVADIKLKPGQLRIE